MFSAVGKCLSDDRTRWKLDVVVARS